MAFSLSAEQQQNLQLQLQQLAAEASDIPLIGQADIPQVEIDPQIREAFEQTLSGQRSPLFQQFGIQIDPSQFRPPNIFISEEFEAFAASQSQGFGDTDIDFSQFQSRERLAEEEEEKEFFEQFQQASDVLPGRDPDELARITSENLRALTEPFVTSQFSPAVIERTIRQNLQAGDIRNRDQLFGRVQDVLAIGVSQALESDDPQNNLLGVFASLGQALRDIGGDANNPAGLATIVDRAAFKLVSRQGLEDLSFIPQTDLASNLAIEALFGDALRDSTMITDLSNAEVQQIARDFAVELRNLVGKPGGTQQKFKNIVNWIDTHVLNETLKTTLKSQARQLEVETIRIESAQQPTIPPELIPTGEKRGVLINRDVAIGFANVLETNINLIGAITDPEERLRNVDTLVNQYNTTVRKLRITVPRAGRAVTPTISKVTADGQKKSPITLVQELQAVAIELPSPTSTFTWLPTKSEGMPLNTREIVEDINERFTKQGRRSKAQRRSILHPSKRAEFGKVIVLSLETEEGHNDYEIVIPPNASIADLMMVIQALLAESGTLFDVDGRVLLNIVKGTTALKHILGAIRKEQKMMLGVEIRLSYKTADPVGGSYLGGALSGIIKKGLGRVIKSHIPPIGIPRIDPRMMLLQEPFYKLHQPVGGSLQLPTDSAGRVDPDNFEKPFHIQITPESENRLNTARFGEQRILPPDAQLRGGNIFGDIFGAIGSVVAAPFQIVGSLLGGQLPADTIRELDMDARRTVSARG